MKNKIETGFEVLDKVMDKVSEALATLLLVTTLCLFLAPKPAEAEDIYSGVTNIVLYSTATNTATTSTGIVITNLSGQVEGIGQLICVGTNQAGTSPTLSPFLMGSATAGSWTNIPNTSMAITSTSNFVASVAIKMSMLPPVFMVTNPVTGTTAQYAYSIILVAPLKYKK